MTTDPKKPWYKKWWAIALFIFLGLGAIENLTDKPTPTTPTATISEAPTVVFDLEALYGKNIDEIRAVLGSPADGAQTNPTDLQLKLGAKEWNNTFKKDGYELLVTYEVPSKKVIDFFISTNDPSGQTRNTKNLEEILGMQSSTNFIIKPVKTMRDPSYYTGIIATPKN